MASQGSTMMRPLAVMMKRNPRSISPEATLVENTVGQLGIAPGRVIYERKSLNTYQNALYAKEIDLRWLYVGDVDPGSTAGQR